jgi:hypothetical protein
MNFVYINTFLHEYLEIIKPLLVSSLFFFMLKYTFIDRHISFKIIELNCQTSVSRKIQLLCII